MGGLGRALLSKAGRRVGLVVVEAAGAPPPGLVTGHNYGLEGAPNGFAGRIAAIAKLNMSDMTRDVGQRNDRRGRGAAT